MLLYDFKQDLAAYLATTPPAVKVRTLADLIAGCSGKGLKGFTYSSATFSIS